MRPSFRVIEIGTVLVIAASGIAYAQKPSVPVQPIPIQPIPSNAAVPTLPSSVLKQVKPLTAVQKLTLVKKHAAATAPLAEQNLDTPIRLSARTPYVDSKNYLSAYDVGFNPFFEPPELDVRGGASMARVQFRAEPERTYLVDCAFDPSSMTQFSTQVYGKVTATDAPVPSTTATLAPPPDRHLTFFVRKEAAARDMVVEIKGTGGNHWYLGACEITPVRGL